uniref:Uncharacterized protein n=1 Tax=Opuntia streptacantha TaxID=393608 RepID=A0A7C9EKX9_OPUST
MSISALPPRGSFFGQKRRRYDIGRILSQFVIFLLVKVIYTHKISAIITSIEFHLSFTYPHTCMLMCCTTVCMLNFFSVTPTRVGTIAMGTICTCKTNPNFGHW